MKRARLLLDANLSVLLYVGSAQRSYIRKHKRLQDFSERDFDILSAFIEESDDMVLCAHVLSETSNLIRHIAEPIRSEVLGVMSAFIKRFEELPISSRTAVERREFMWLGLTDAVLLEAIDAGVVLLTTDQELCGAANERLGSAISFDDLRGARFDRLN